MNSLYKSPLKVYLVMGILALAGVFAGLNLPISLYPNSNRPTIWVSVNYGPYTSDEFKKLYGERIESTLSGLSTTNLETDKVTAQYYQNNLEITTEFQWGAEPKEALQEIQIQMSSLLSSSPKEIRDSLGVNFWSRSSGFIAISFFSDQRSEDELYRYLEPLLTPKLLQVKDAEAPQLWNPTNKEIVIELHAESMSMLGLFPQDIENAVNRSLQSLNAGSLDVGLNKMSITLPRVLVDTENLGMILLETSSGKRIHLNQVASIDIRDSGEGSSIFKTNGAKSLILFAKPRSGGNVKKMAEDILDIVNELKPSFPSDVQFRVLVDPSEFIRASVSNVLKEVFVAGFLAVLVLFFFIGSFRNTITAALEIPLSIILAFIMMKFFNMNLNLISLGGLALAAGMNVDASVVVMENIFRHFEAVKGPLNPELRLKIIVRAVKEVMLPIVASTISSLVVFAPLAMTSALTNAILGDLAKAVVFSHGLSAIVALVLVPTIRMQLMNVEKGGHHIVSPFEKWISAFERLYKTMLAKLINTNWMKLALLATSSIALILSLVYLVPKLEKEIIGLPDTDWIILGAGTSGNTKKAQMDDVISELENTLLSEFGDDINYTFVQINGANNGNIMAKLKNKKDMNRVWKAIEEKFENTPTVSYWVVPWNPAELPIPNPPQMRLTLRGGDEEDRFLMAQSLLEKLKEKEPFSRIWSDPSVSKEQQIEISPRTEQWQELAKRGETMSSYVLADLLRVVTNGKRIGDIQLDNTNYPIVMNYPGKLLTAVEDLESYPMLVDGKIVPLRSMVDIKTVDTRGSLYREDGRDLLVISGKQNKGHEKEAPEGLKKAQEIIDDFKLNDLPKMGLKSNPSIQFEDAQKDLNEALEQLGIAVGISLLLVLFTLLLQFGSIVQTLIIMTAIPFGLLGVIVSLWVFQSTLSLNSVLGVILLNGIAVSNSIILVDCLLRYVKEGMAPKEAALLAAQTRLRPILITSLTTILGMLPIALGSGEGGKILQPLGIAVAGGLWFSMVFTLFVVPMIECWVLKPHYHSTNKKNQNAVQSDYGESEFLDSEETEWLQ